MNRRMFAFAGLTSAAALSVCFGFGVRSRLAYAAGPEPTAPSLEDAAKVDAKYVGPKKCKLCHVADSTGAQFKIWEKSQHAKAFERLGSPEAKEVAKAKNIADPQKAPECLKCHTTGFGEPAAKIEKIAHEDGVSCEACHGAGELYGTKEVFEKGRAEAVAKGMRLQDEKVCKQCHNEESPNFKGFNYEEYAKKIAHPTPKK